VLDAWDNATQLFVLALAMLVIVNGVAFWTVGRALAPFPVIAAGLERLQRGELSYRLPPLGGFEARAMGAAFNRMAQAVEDNVQAERKARDAEIQLEERREMAKVVEQRIEEERRAIAHELHDEFGQSVTAIRSLAVAIATRCGTHDPEMASTAQLIADEAGRLYDAMHGLIPRLTPLSLDTVGLSEILENWERDWQRQHPSIALTVRKDLAAELGPSVTLAVYRVLQEGVLNTLRHAHASRVDISVQADEKRILVSVTDDGVGLRADWSRPGHFGLRGLAERVANLDGVFDVGSAAPHGVRLAAEIPLAAHA
jgi:two-component system sensor histidine kinase UhpB